MQGFIYRVENIYGTRDYNSLQEAKRNSDNSEYIQLVHPDGLTILSRVKRASACWSWVLRTIERQGLTYTFLCE